MSHLTLVASESSQLSETTVARRTLLDEFLAAELAPGISIEKACYPSIILFELECQPTPMEVAQSQRLLMAAGLVYVEHDPFEPGYIVLAQPKKFAEKFPNLTHVIPFILDMKKVPVLSDSPLIARRRLTIVP